jgi:hypothetical protein
VKLPQARTGGVTVLDNHLAMHGRRTYQGQRQILAAFVTD